MMSVVFTKKINDLPLAILRFDKTRVRVAYSDVTIGEYAAAMKGGAEFPPIIVYFDGQDHWVADGFYRCRATQLLERETIKAELRRGTLQDAIVCAVGSNADHGVRRTKEDVETSVVLLLQDHEWLKRPDKAVAAACRTNTTYVGEFRKKHNLYGDFIQYPDGRKFPVSTIRARDRRRVEKVSERIALRSGMPSEEIGHDVEALKIHLTRASLVAQRIEEHEGESKQASRMIATLRELKEWADNWEVWLKKKSERLQSI